MKKIKYIALIICFLILVRVIIVFIIRAPSYTIQTTGKLYIVDELSSDIKVFDLLQGKELIEYPIKAGMHDIASLSDQNRIVVTNYGTQEIKGNSITVINTKSNTVEKTIYLDEGIRPHGVVFIPETNKVALVTDGGNYFLVINIETGIIEKKIKIEQRGSHHLAIHPNKPIAFVTNSSAGSLSIIDLELDKLIKIIRCGKGTNGIDITKDGSEVWVTNTKDNSINIINTDILEITDTLNSGKEPLILKFSIDGVNCLVANGIDGNISVFNRHSRKEIKKISIPGKKTLVEKILYHTPHPVNVLMHSNGLYAFVSNSNANKIEVIDMKTFELVSNIGTGKLPKGLAFIE
ncbi:beta-propeller fold lactonase family protein [Lutibacter sp.]|uniref:beta-propeller fold lactonase family protein n=1 Tax=Lutibacter sp. TaxID=1925666 RepID=UPI001A268EB7|nr:beta-propeller fold lactonase family protein [Lutibacter sp.]MBI9039859.1 beta-propeller fold lactonase family protein [Lutibacter sp.]